MWMDLRELGEDIDIVKRRGDGYDVDVMDGD